MSDIILVNREGSVWASSREIAERFSKENKHINETIKKLIVENSTVKSMFVKAEYQSSRGRMETEYLMNRDGFSLLVMGFTGSKALKWKLKYIEAFNVMENALKEQTQKLLPLTYKEALSQLLLQVEKNEQLELENKELFPKAKYYDDVIEKGDAVTSTIWTRIKDSTPEQKRKYRTDKLGSTSIAVLDYIHEFINKIGYCPTFREIGKGVGIASSSTVQLHMDKLNDYGYIVKNPKEARNTRLNEEKYVKAMAQFK